MNIRKVIYKSFNPNLKISRKVGAFRPINLTLLAEAFPLCFSVLYCHCLRGFGCSRFVLVVSVPRKRPLQTAEKKHEQPKQRREWQYNAEKCKGKASASRVINLNGVKQIIPSLNYVNIVSEAPHYP